MFPHFMHYLIVLEEGKLHMLSKKIIFILIGCFVFVVLTTGCAPNPEVADLTLKTYPPGPADYCKITEVEPLNLTFRVENKGDREANESTARIIYDNPGDTPDESFDVPVPAIASGDFVEVSFPWNGECVNSSGTPSGCTIRILIDSNKGVPEAIENNNEGECEIVG